jgi:hypothetical protein
MEQLKKENNCLKAKLKELSTLQEGEQPQPEEMDLKRMPKDLNSLITNDLRKKVEEEYMRGDKYLKKMTAQEEEELYRNWKNSNFCSI